MWVINGVNQPYISTHINVFTLILDQRLMSPYYQYRKHNQVRFLHQMDFQCNPFQQTYYTDCKRDLCFHIYESVYILKLSNFTTGFKSNPPLFRHTSNGCFYIIEKNSEYTVFYQKFGFPYLLNIRIVCIRTCSDTLVPTYKYPLYGLSLYDMFYAYKTLYVPSDDLASSQCVFGDEGSKIKVRAVIPN